MAGYPLKESDETGKIKKKHVEEKIKAAYVYTFPQVSHERDRGEVSDRTKIFTQLNRMQLTRSLQISLYY